VDSIWYCGLALVFLLSILTSGNDVLWEGWKESTTGRCNADYRDVKNKFSGKLLCEAEELFGPLKGLKMLDACTPLTICDWVNSPAGCAY